LEQKQDADKTMKKRQDFVEKREKERRWKLGYRGRNSMYKMIHRVVGSRKPSIESTRRDEGRTCRKFWESRNHQNM